MGEIGNALEEVVCRKADLQLRLKVDALFNEFQSKLSDLFHQHDASPPEGIGLHQLRKEAFELCAAGARLRAVEAVLRDLSQEQG